MRKTLLLVSALALVLLVVACTPKIAPPPTPAVPAPAAAAPAPVSAALPAAPAKPAWQETWDKTLEAARKEGKVALATSVGAATRTELTQGFKNAYGIPIESIGGHGTGIGARILAERRAGLHFWDVLVSGTTTQITQLKPAGILAPIDSALILPDLTDPEFVKKTWYRGRLPWIDSDHTMIAGLVAPSSPIAINTNLVKEGEIKSFNDLLHPKWKGKMMMSDPTVAGTTGTSFIPMTAEVMGADWLRALAKQDPIILRDDRLVIDWLAHGKVAIALSPKRDVFMEFKGAGAPIQSLVPQEGTWVSTGASGICLFDRPPHPNAAKLLINWILSKEGQTILGKMYNGQTGREDVPTNYLPPDLVRTPSGNYWLKESEEVLLKGPEYFKLSKEIFGPLMK